MIRVGIDGRVDNVDGARPESAHEAGIVPSLDLKWMDNGIIGLGVMNRSIGLKARNDLCFTLCPVIVAQH